MVKRYLALVQWVIDKQYTVGIPITWIKDFDRESFVEYDKDNDSANESYIVEWRQGKKPPKAGWTVYDGYVIMISDRVSNLEKRFQELQGILSPRKISNRFSPKGKQIEEKNVDPSMEENNEQSRDSSEDIETDDDKSQSCSSTEKTKKRNSSSLSKNKIPVKSDKTTKKSKTSSLPKQSSNSASSNDESSGEDNEKLTLAKLSKIISKKDDIITKLMSEVKAIKDSLQKNNGQFNNLPRRPQFKSGSQNFKNADNLGDGKFVEGLIEIGEPGTGITVNDIQWTTAISRDSYKFMATSLMTSLFTIEELLKSNYKGGLSKIKKPNASSSTKLEALDEKKIQAIMYTVRRFCPKFTIAGFGMAINTKLCEMRAKQNNATTFTDGENI